jgi:MFS family permease
VCSILLIFGVLAGLINTLMVGRYGFVASDTAIDGAIAAFYFGIISLGAIGGPAVAVHFAARRRWMWGIVFGLIAAVSLGANVVNSLGALAGRNDKTQAERVKAREDAKDDRAQLARLAGGRARGAGVSPYRCRERAGGP